uniref:Toxin Tbo-IT2 n=1 Tax=Tibellus oblongus TaxID=336685 RepID=TBO2_TIBOB|nr:RecName: Full=Toxin Tbo-IT2; Flags: Precursor [Tibellus oblongus]
MTMKTLCLSLIVIGVLILVAVKAEDYVNINSLEEAPEENVNINNLEETPEESRCIQRHRSCRKSSECCGCSVCQCNLFGQNCQCKSGGLIACGKK